MISAWISQEWFQSNVIKLDQPTYCSFGMWKWHRHPEKHFSCFIFSVFKLTWNYTYLWSHVMLQSVHTLYMSIHSKHLQLLNHFSGFFVVKMIQILSSSFWKYHITVFSSYPAVHKHKRTYFSDLSVIIYVPTFSIPFHLPLCPYSDNYWFFSMPL